MVTDHEVVVPLPELNAITTLDLKLKDREFERKVDFSFISHEINLTQAASVRIVVD